MEHITKSGVVQAWHIKFDQRDAVLFYAGKEGVDINTIKLPAPFTIVHGFAPPEFLYCNWLSEYLDQIYDHGKTKPDMVLRKLLYCLEDECHFLCDNAAYDGFILGLVYPEDIDFTNNRLDFGFCEEEVLFTELSEFVKPYQTLMDNPSENILRLWNEVRKK